jgi:hypothetical protein
MATEQGKNKRNIQTLSAELEALADMKFSYVISCQKFGEQKIKGDPHAQDIIDLMMRYEMTYISLWNINNFRKMMVTRAILIFFTCAA